MEDRIARLEKSVDRLDDRVATVREDIATIKENMRHLPSKPWMFTTLGALASFLLLLFTIITGLIVRYMPHG